MNRKIQSISLALGGFFVLLGVMFDRIEWDWVGVGYVSLCMIIGFLNWIEIDKTQNKAKSSLNN